jgi:hypothetical protein
MELSWIGRDQGVVALGLKAAESLGEVPALHRRLELVLRRRRCSARVRRRP